MALALRWFNITLQVLSYEVILKFQRYFIEAETRKAEDKSERLKMMDIRRERERQRERERERERKRENDCEHARSGCDCKFVKLCWRVGVSI